MQHSHTLRRSLLLALTLLAACAASAPGDSSPADESSARGAGLTAAYLTGRYAAIQHDEGFAADQLTRALAADPDNADLRQQAFMATLLAGRPEAVQIAATLPTNPVAQLLLADTDAKAGPLGAGRNPLCRDAAPGTHATVAAAAGGVVAGRRRPCRHRAVHPAAWTWKASGCRRSMPCMPR